MVPSIPAPVAPSIQPPEASSTVFRPEPPSHPEPEASLSVVAPEAPEASSSAVALELSTPVPNTEAIVSVVSARGGSRLGRDSGRCRGKGTR